MSPRGTPERFLTTVVMTDMVGSTEHAAELGDHGWHELLDLHHTLVRAALRRSGGREIDTAGDGFFVTFDAPAAAVGFALEIERGVAELGVDIRAGVHVGEVEQMGRKVTGLTVVIASRIMAAASAGEVLVSSTVRDLTTGSSLAFADRGTRELKGVPGEWHVFAVERAGAELVDTSGPATATERRAAAVRRATARPIWQRRPRLVIATALGLAVVLATGGLILARPWQPAALASVTEDSIGIIDPARNEVIGQIPVGTRPGGIAVGGGSAWVANTSDGTVSQIDLVNRSAIHIIDVGRSPRGIAWTEGSVWVVNSGERTVSRINIATGRVVQIVEVGNGPTAIAASGDGLWVANATDSTIVRLDAASGDVGEPVGVAATPVAVAADADGLWVASEDGASVSHLDPSTGIPRAAPVQLATPSAIALDPESVWVASADGTVSRIDRAKARITSTVDVGGRPTAIAIDTDSIWVGDRDGVVHRLDPDDPASAPARIATTSAVATLAIVDGDPWFGAHASTASHRGGTLRIVQYLPDRLARYDADPLGSPFYNVVTLEGDGLVGYRRVGGSAGSTLLADLATSVPRPTNGGLTYTFQLRPDVAYATGTPVRAADFRRAIERSFQLGGVFGPWGPFLFPAIAGADACVTDDGGPIEHCDLSSGIATDDVLGTVTFTLKTGDPDFLLKLAHPAGYPVPDGVPMNAFVVGAPFPGTGPYTVTSATDNEIHLGRNPTFRSWDAAVRPDGYPDEIIFTIVGSDAERIAMVESGDADYTSYSGLTRTPRDDFSRIKTQYADRWHVGTVSTGFVELNTSVAPFDDVRVRQALNLAMDRDRFITLGGGLPDTAATCQILPPGFPGYQPYCPYTLHADAGGRWKEPDIVTAQGLVDASGTRGGTVVVGPTFGQLIRELEYVGEVLTDLGYQVTVDRTDRLDPSFTGFAEGAQLTVSGWSPDYIGAGNFLGLFTCGGDDFINFCDPGFDAAFKHAAELQATDPAAAAAEWAAVDRRAVDLAVLAPTYNQGGHFVSAKVGNFQFSPTGNVLFDQLWVQ